MEFEQIRYLDWAKTNMGKVKYDLANGAIPSLTAAELEIDPKELVLTTKHYYGDPELISLVAQTYSVPEKNVLLVPSASFGMFLAYQTVLSRGDEMLLEAPNYEPLYRLAQWLELYVKMLDRPFDKAFQIELESLERRISRKTRAVVMTNAHNPSGAVTNPEKMRTIGQIARSVGAFVIVGEVYLDCSFNGLPPASATLGENIITVSSLSKVYGLGGLRLGWMLMPENLIEKATNIMSYSANECASPSQSIAIKAFQKLPWLRERAKAIVTRNFWILREWFAQRTDIQWVPPGGGTVCFAKLPTGIESRDLVNRLKEKYDTLVVPGDFFWAKGYVRIGLGGPEDILRAGLKNLGSALDDLNKRKRP
jgi:aspartate/methionine/tyrosine aminotransferase